MSTPQLMILMAGLMVVVGGLIVYALRVQTTTGAIKSIEELTADLLDSKGKIQWLLSEVGEQNRRIDALQEKISLMGTENHLLRAEIEQQRKRFASMGMEGK